MGIPPTSATKRDTGGMTGCLERHWEWEWQQGWGRCSLLLCHTALPWSRPKGASTLLLDLCTAMGELKQQHSGCSLSPQGKGHTAALSGVSYCHRALGARGEQVCVPPTPGDLQQLFTLTGQLLAMSMPPIPPAGTEPSPGQSHQGLASQVPTGCGRCPCHYHLARTPGKQRGTEELYPPSPATATLQRCSRTPGWQEGRTGGWRDRWMVRAGRGEACHDAPCEGRGVAAWHQGFLLPCSALPARALPWSARVNCPGLFLGLYLYMCRGKGAPGHPWQPSQKQVLAAPGTPLALSHCTPKPRAGRCGEWGWRALAGLRVPSPRHGGGLH